MQQNKAILLWMLIFTLWLASCGVQSQINSTNTAAPPPPTSDTPQPSPNPTMTVTQRSTETPTITPSFTNTAAITTTATPACFTPADIIVFGFMPDGQRILIRTMGGVQIFNLTTLQEDRFFKAPKNVITAAISPDGERLAWSLEDNSLQLVRVADGEVISAMTEHTDMVGKLRFSPSGDRLYSASHDTWVRVWDMSGKEVDAFQPIGADFPSEVLGIGISPDGKQLASIPFDGPVKIWDLATHQLVETLGGGGGFDTSDPVFSSDGKYLAADLASGLYLWDLSDGKSMWDAPINSMAVAFSPDGKTLAYVDIGANNDIVLASPDGAQIYRTLSGYPLLKWELVFSPDGKLLASNDGQELRIWRVEDGALLYVGKASCP